MRIDKIIEKITRIFFSGNDIPRILNGKISWRLRGFLWLISLKKRIMLSRKWVFRGLKNREWLAAYDIAASSFSAVSRKEGISAVARLKNASDFLEVCARALMPYIDEMILLVDTNSTDATEDICHKLAREFPQKCQCITYSPPVYPGNHPQYSATSDDSVHALSYFYNFAFSHSHYRYVCKFDDDMLVIPENFQKMVEYIRVNKPHFFLALPQINVSRDTHGNLAIATKYLHSGLAGMFGDHGIFPLSEKTYFFNDVGCENMVLPYSIQYGEVSFLHLKALKSDGGKGNYTGYALEYLKALKQGSAYIPLPQKYQKLLADLDIT